MKNIDVNKPVENPELVLAFQIHMQNKTEKTALSLGKKLNEAVYLVPIITDDMQTTPNGSNTVTIEAGSKIKFMNCQNQKGENFLPVFTDWNEIRKWINFEIATFVMPANELWDFALQNKDNQGIVINPGSLGWTLLLPNIKALVEDSKNP